MRRKAAGWLRYQGRSGDQGGPFKDSIIACFQPCPPSDPQRFLVPPVLKRFQGREA